MKKKVIKWLVIEYIILIVIAILFYQHSSKLAEQKSSKTTAKTTGSWPIFRGNQQLNGYVKSIPKKAVVAWTFKAEAMVDAGLVCDADRMYFGNSEGMFYCLNVNTGKIVWKKKISDGINASALLVDGVCYVGSQSGEFLALSMADGKILWRHEIGEQINGSANFFREQGKLRIIFGAYDFKLHCLDAKNGKEEWSVKTENYINGAPAVNNKRIIFGGCDGYLRTVDALLGKEKNKLKLKSYIPASPAIYDSITYVALYGEKVFAINKENKILWTYEPNDKSAFLSSPAVNPDFVVIGDRDGLIHILKRLNGKKVAEFQTTGDIAVGQIVSDKRALAADKDGFIYIFDLFSGKEIWTYQIGPAITAPITVYGDKIIVADNDGNITAFKGTK